MRVAADANASFPFFSILALIFITLKLTGLISWSWWWVLSPIWLPVVVLLFVVVVCAAIVSILGSK